VTFDLSQLDRTWRTEEFRVNTVRLAQFAAAIDDESPAHRNGAIAPPLFANVPPMQPCIEALRSVTTEFAFHGEHDFHFHRPIRPGMHLFSQATLRGVVATRGGVSIIVHSKTQEKHGALVDEQYFIAFVAGASLPRSIGEPPPKVSPFSGSTAGAPVARATYPLASDQTFRYADASRDYADYTLRLDAARARGFEHIVVHGMLTMAFAARAVVAQVCAGDSTRLKRFAGRFSNPVFLIPDQALMTRLWKLDSGEGRERFRFETSDAAGNVVMKNGLAEVSE
jgi:acyl dehydratase